MNFTADDYAKFGRVAGYIVFTALASFGVHPDGSTVGLVTGVLGNVAMVVWTLYGSTISAKLAAAAAIPGVTAVVDPTKAPAAAVVAANDDKLPDVITKRQAETKFAA